MNFPEGFRRLRRAAQISLFMGIALIGASVALRIFSSLHDFQPFLINSGFLWAIGIYLVFFGALGCVAAWIGEGFFVRDSSQP